MLLLLQAAKNKSITMLLLLLPLLGVLATAAAQPPQAPPATATATFVIAAATDLVMYGTTITTAGCPAGSVSLRSGGQHSTSSAVAVKQLSPGITVTGVAFAYQYTTGYTSPKIPISGSNFSLAIGGVGVYASPPLTLFPYSKASNFSPPTPVALKGLVHHVAPGAGVCLYRWVEMGCIALYCVALHRVGSCIDFWSILAVAPGADNQLAFYFQNNDRNMQLLLPMTITVTCTGGPCVASPKLLPQFFDSNMVLQRGPTKVQGL